MINVTCDAPASCSGQLSCIDCFEQLKQQGSFDTTCTGCVYNYKSLVCDCLKKDKTTVRAEYYFDNGPCPSGLSNDDGRLTC
jgi:hypothetical protein